MSFNKKRKTLVEEPCTLVYTLNNSDDLKFDDFSLLIRGMHSYMVEEITPYEETLTVHVKLSYQASIENATKKLKDLANYCTISKLSSFVKDTEIARLNALKQRFKITGGSQSNAAEGGNEGRWKEPTRRYRDNTTPSSEI